MAQLITHDLESEAGQGLKHVSHHTETDTSMAQEKPPVIRPWLVWYPHLYGTREALSNPTVDGML